MKLEEAIEILEAHETSVGLTPPIHLRPAIKLGIEALKRCQYIAEHTDRWAGVLLEGETKD